MERIVGLDNEYMTVACLPDLGVVHHTMHRFVVSSAFRAALEIGLELLRTHQATKWLSDDRANSALSKQDVTWLATDWEPRTIEAGWRYWAMVMPEAVFGKMIIQRRVAAANAVGLNARTFEEPDAALAWLSTLPGGTGFHRP
jgi:hypothetical protein